MRWDYVLASVKPAPKAAVRFRPLLGARWISAGTSLCSKEQLIIDVVPGRGSSFSLEAPEGVRFLTRSRVFTDQEAAALAECGVPARGDAWVSSRGWRPPRRRPKRRALREATLI